MSDPTDASKAEPKPKAESPTPTPASPTPKPKPGSKKEEKIHQAAPEPKKKAEEQKYDSDESLAARFSKMMKNHRDFTENTLHVAAAPFRYVGNKIANKIWGDKPKPEPEQPMSSLSATPQDDVLETKNKSANTAEEEGPKASKEAKPEPDDAPKPK